MILTESLCRKAIVSLVMGCCAVAPGQVQSEGQHTDCDTYDLPAGPVPYCNLVVQPTVPGVAFICDEADMTVEFSESAEGRTILFRERVRPDLIALLMDAEAAPELARDELLTILSGAFDCSADPDCAAPQAPIPIFEGLTRTDLDQIDVLDTLAFDQFAQNTSPLAGGGGLFDTIDRPARPDIEVTVFSIGPKVWMGFQRNAPALFQGADFGGRSEIGLVPLKDVPVSCRK